MAAVALDANTDKIRGSHLAQLFVNRKIAVRKERKGNIVGLAKVFYFIGRIADADPDNFNLVFQIRIPLDLRIDLVDGGRLSLAMGAVHAEEFDNDNVGPDFRYFEWVLPLQTEVVSVDRILRHLQPDIREFPTCDGGGGSGGRRNLQTGGKCNQSNENKKSVFHCNLRLRLAGHRSASVDGFIKRSCFKRSCKKIAIKACESRGMKRSADIHSP